MEPTNSHRCCTVQSPIGRWITLCPAASLDPLALSLCAVSRSLLLFIFIRAITLQKESVEKSVPRLTQGRGDIAKLCSPRSHLWDGQLSSKARVSTLCRAPPRWIERPSLGHSRKPNSILYCSTSPNAHIRSFGQAPPSLFFVFSFGRKREPTKGVGCSGSRTSVYGFEGKKNKSTPRIAINRQNWATPRPFSRDFSCL